MFTLNVSNEAALRCSLPLLNISEMHFKAKFDNYSATAAGLGQQSKTREIYINLVLNCVSTITITTTSNHNSMHPFVFVPC